MIRPKLLYSLFLLFLFLTSSISAQDNQLQSYTLEDGLPQSQVYDILQDEKGYLWLGTQGGGLSRFNGEEFKVWNEDNGLLSNYIFSLAQSNDTLFIGTRRGFSIKYKESLRGLNSKTIFRGQYEFCNGKAIRRDGDASARLQTVGKRNIFK